MSFDTRATLDDLQGAGFSVVGKVQHSRHINQQREKSPDELFHQPISKMMISAFMLSSRKEQKSTYFAGLKVSDNSSSRNLLEMTFHQRHWHQSYI
jgi:hypothetical protein